MTDTLNTAEIRARAEAATLGPWEMGGEVVYTTRIAIHQDSKARKVNPLGWQRACICREARIMDGAFIAHARADVPALCDEVDRLRVMLARWEYWAEYGKWPEDAEVQP